MGSEEQDCWKWSGPLKCLENFSPLLQPQTWWVPKARRPGRGNDPSGHRADLAWTFCLISTTEYIESEPESEITFIWPLLHHSPSFLLISKVGESCLLRSVLWSPALSACSFSVFILFPSCGSFLLAHTHASVSFEAMPFSSSWFLSAS